MANGNGSSITLRIVGLALTAVIVMASAIYAYGQLTADVRRNCEDIKAHAKVLDRLTEGLQGMQVEQARTLVGIEQILKRLEDKQ